MDSKEIKEAIEHDMELYQRRQKQQIELVPIICPGCGKTFGIDRQIEGVVTCPYCSNFVEG